MIDVASQATNGVKFPGRKATRVEIKRMFGDYIMKLKGLLNVCKVRFSITHIL
jgi:hypothetical protein